MKRSISLLLIMMYLSLLSAIAEYGCIFLAIPSSARTCGMGEDTGTADFWHNDAFVSYNNPSLSSLHQGVYYSINKDAWLDDVSGIDDMYFYNGYINLAWKGIGICLPMYNLSDRFGTNMDYGKQERTDEYGNFLGSFNSNEQALRYNVSVNSSMINHFQENLLIGAGLTYVDIRSNLCPDGISPSNQVVDGTGRGNSLDLGLFAKMNFKDILWPESKFETGIGYHSKNINNKKVIYNENSKDVIYTDNNIGISARFSIFNPNSDYLLFKKSSDGSGDFVSILFTINQNRVCNYTIDSWGAEFGFFNMFFLRAGNYNNVEGRIQGNTYGVGFKYFMNKNLNFQLNYAEFPGGELQAVQSSMDFTLGYKI